MAVLGSGCATTRPLPPDGVENVSASAPMVAKFAVKAMMGALDSATSACERFPAQCIAQVGEEGVLPEGQMPALRLVHSVREPASATASPSLWQIIKTFATASAVTATKDVPRNPGPYTEADQAEIGKVLAECADMARSEVLFRRNGDKSPSPEKCKEKVATDNYGGAVTNAMRWGEEMHVLATDCAEAVLSRLRPGGYAIEATYQFDPANGSVHYLTDEALELLLKEGRQAELIGSIRPDVVIHTGNPMDVQDVFDFKFPCVNLDDIPRWPTYKSGPYQLQRQGDVYKRLLKLAIQVARVFPRRGVFR